MTALVLTQSAPLEGEILGPLKGQRQAIAIDDIIIDEKETQIRDRMDFGHVRVLVGVIETYDEGHPEQAGDGVARGFESEAVEVDEISGREGRIAYYLVSGFHRVEAARRAGKSHVLADVFPDRGQPFREWRAGQANATHGKALKPKERKRQLHRYYRANLHKVPGPRGGLRHGDLKSPLEIRKENGGLSYRTFWKWTRDYSSLLAKDLREQFGQEQEEEDNPLPMTPEGIKQVVANRKMLAAFQLGAVLSRVLTDQQMLDNAEAVLEEMLQDIRSRQPSPFD